jgi:hypothetical protein
MVLLNTSTVFFQMSDSNRTQVVVQQLFDCMYSSCCPTTPTIPAVVTCNIARGHTGEIISVLTPPLVG